MQTQKIQSVEVKSRTDFRNLDKFDTYTKNGIYFINDLYDVTHTKEGESEFIARPYINPYYNHKRPLLRDGYYFQSKDNEAMLKEYSNFGTDNLERQYNIRRDIASEFRPFHTFHFTDETGWYGITEEERAGQDEPSFISKQYIWFSAPPFDYTEIRKHQRRKRYYEIHSYTNPDFRSSSFPYNEGFARRVNMGFKGLNYSFVRKKEDEGVDDPDENVNFEMTPSRKNLYVMANANFTWDNNTGFQFLQATANDKPDRWVNRPNTDFNGNIIVSMEELKFDFKKKYGLTYEEYQRRLKEEKVNADRGKWGFGGNEFYNGSAPGYMYSTKGGYPSFLNGNSSGSSSYKSFFEKNKGYIDPTEDYLIEALPVYTGSTERKFTGELVFNEEDKSRIKNGKGTLDVMGYYEDEDGILPENMMAELLKEYVQGVYVGFYDYDNPVSELESRDNGLPTFQTPLLDWSSEIEIPSTQYRVLENYLVEEGLLYTTEIKNSPRTISRHPLHTEYTYHDNKGKIEEIVPSYYRINKNVQPKVFERDYTLSKERVNKIDKNISSNIFKYGNGFLDFDNIYYPKTSGVDSDYYFYYQGIQRNKVYDDLVYSTFISQNSSLFKAEGHIDLIRNKYSSGQNVMDRMPLTYTQTWDGNIFTPAYNIRKKLGDNLKSAMSFDGTPFGTMTGYSEVNYHGQYYSVGAFSNSYFMSYGPNTSQMLLYTPSIIFSTDSYITQNKPKYKRNGALAINNKYLDASRQAYTGIENYYRVTASYDDVFAKLGVLFVMGTENYMLQKFVNREYTFYRYRIDGKWTNWKHDYPQGSTHLSNIDFYDNSEVELNVLKKPLGNTHFNKIEEIYDVKKYSKILESVKDKNLNWTNINYAMGFGAFGQQYSKDGIDNLRPKGRLYHEHDIFDYLGYHPLSRKFDFTTDDAIIKEADDVLIRDMTVPNLYFRENGDFTYIHFTRETQGVKLERNGTASTYTNNRETQGIKYRKDKNGPNYDLIVTDKSNPMKLIAGNSEDMDIMNLCSRNSLSTMIEIYDNTSGIKRENWNNFTEKDDSGQIVKYIWNRDCSFLGRVLSKNTYQISKMSIRPNMYTIPNPNHDSNIIDIENRKIDNKYMPDIFAYTIDNFIHESYYLGFILINVVDDETGHPIVVFTDLQNQEIKRLSKEDSKYLFILLYHITDQKLTDKIVPGPILNDVGIGREMNLPSYRGLNINEGATRLSDVMTDFDVIGNKINDYSYMRQNLLSRGMEEQFQYMVDNPDNPDVQKMLKDMHDKDACIMANDLDLYSYESKGESERKPIEGKFTHKPIIAIFNTDTNRYELTSYESFEKYMNKKYKINISTESTGVEKVPIKWNIISIGVKENYFNYSE